MLFSANVIPNPMNFGQRYLVEQHLKMAGARIFEDLHVSGHAYREDHYEFIQPLKPAAHHPGTWEREDDCRHTRISPASSGTRPVTMST